MSTGNVRRNDVQQYEKKECASRKTQWAELVKKKAGDGEENESPDSRGRGIRELRAHMVNVVARGRH